MSTAVLLSPPPILQFFNNAGQPNAGGSVLTQVGGINHPTYQDSGGNTALPNPIPLNSRGEISNSSGVSCQLFLEAGIIYTFTIYDSTGAQINQVAWMGSASLQQSDYASGNLGRVVDSIAALRALSHSSYTRAFVTGYYAAGDGGGGEYWYDPTDTTSADNGGTIIVASDGGRWKLAQSEVVSLKQFGAKTDGSDASTAINAAFSWAQANNATLDVSGNFSVTKVTLSGANGMALQGRGSLVGIATSATDCVLELINSSDITINGRLAINAAYNTNYSYGVHAYTNAAGQNVNYLDFTNLPVVGAQVGYAFGNTARPDDQCSEINVRGGYTYGCPGALLAMGTETVVNVQGANLISGYGSGGTSWQALPQKTVVAVGATVAISGGELLHPAISAGSLCEIQPLGSVTQGINIFGNISVHNAVCEPACPLATTANPNALASPQNGCIQFVGCNAVHTQNSFALVQTDSTFVGRLIFSANYFHATVARTFANISCGGNCDVYCDDYSFGTNFVQGLSGITGGIVHFSHRRILEVSSTNNQSFGSGSTVIAKYIGVLNNADTTGRFANAYSTSTGQFTAPQPLKDVEVSGSGYFAALTTTPVFVDIYLDGAQKARYATTSNQWFGGNPILIGDLASGDVVDIRFTQSSGSAQTESGGALAKFIIKARY